RTFPHHLAKLDTPKENFLLKRAQQILDGINAEQGFPAHLNMESQGLFAIGYYQQWNNFFTKKEDTEE
ncbi:MAG: type I-C CRISPR-associated protein Cas8c/Csd1, partial [Opitutales bacterium]|nr:type I-C CRISPR-associated protein Cas8c/Csd1 [Opitutales bacterium]